MKTVGKVIKDARLAKRYSVIKMENLTRIKKDFIEAIEEENWNALPPFPTVLGFVKSLSAPLDLSEKSTVAILKRDYPPKKVNINPKPDVTNKFVWSPKLTFIVGISFAILIILSYLGFQYFKFISPPYLAVTSPRSGQVVTSSTVLVSGSTDSDAKVVVNNQPIVVGDDGSFSVDLSVVKSTTEIKIVATSRSGKTTTVSRTISVR